MRNVCYALYRSGSPYPAVVAPSFAAANNYALSHGWVGHCVDEVVWYSSDGYPAYLFGVEKIPAPVKASCTWPTEKAACKGCYVVEFLEPSGLCSGCEDSAYSEAY